MESGNSCCRLFQKMQYQGLMPLRMGGQKGSSNLK